MALKYCRFCNAALGVGENVPSVGDFCSDDHRRQYQEKIQRETIERLRRTEARPHHSDSPSAPPASTRSTLQPGLPPNLIPTPPLQSGQRAAASNSAVAFAIQPDIEPQSAIETHAAAVPPALAELAKAAEPITVPTGGPIQKTDNAALSSILRQAKGRIQSDPAAQTTALALRRKPRPVAKPAQPAAAATPAARQAQPPTPAAPVPTMAPAAGPAAFPSMAPAARGPVTTVRTIQIVEEPEPATEPVAPPVAAPKPSSAVRPQPQATFTPAPAAPTMVSRGVQIEVEVPNLAFTSATDQSFFARMPWFAKLGLVLALAGAGAGAYWQMEKSAATSRASAKPVEDRIVPLAMLSAGWSNTTAEGAEAIKQGRVLTVYKPSLELTDYRVEFTGEITHRAMGWVYRMKDPANYYAAKLHLNPVAKVRLNLVRWTVKDGVAGEKVWIPLDGPLPSNGRYVVRLDAKGDTFTTRVQGRPADRFTDTTFAKGGFAYANENTERGRVELTTIGIVGPRPAAK